MHNLISDMPHAAFIKNVQIRLSGMVPAEGGRLLPDSWDRLAASGGSLPLPPLPSPLWSPLLLLPEELEGLAGVAGGRGSPVSLVALPSTTLTRLLMSALSTSTAAAEQEIKHT